MLCTLTSTLPWGLGGTGNCTVSRAPPGALMTIALIFLASALVLLIIQSILDGWVRQERGSLLCVLCNCGILWQKLFAAKGNICRRSVDYHTVRPTSRSSSACQYTPSGTRHEAPSDPVKIGGSDAPRGCADMVHVVKLCAVILVSTLHGGMAQPGELHSV